VSVRPATSVPSGVVRVIGMLLLTAACGRWHFDPIATDDGNTTHADAPMIASNIVFVTPSVLSAGSLNGLAGADAACRMYAMQAGLPGTYVAYLSTSTVNAIDRLSGARGWTRPDGTPFADTPADIAAGRIYSTPIVQADGTRPATSNSPRQVATGTTNNGTVSIGNTCNDYSSTTANLEVGSATATGSMFSTLRAAASCGAALSIYCFGVDRSIAVPPPTPTTSNRRAFLSSAWLPGGGLAGADAHCQADATTAGITGSFEALLATASASAASRFSTSGLPWMRLDGQLVAASATNLLTDTRYVLAPLNLTADREYVALASVWTGGADTFTLGGSTCTDWTSSVPGQSGYLGTAQFADPDWFYDLNSAGPSQQACNVSARLYCLEL
jgi:uncharacterized protein DUF1554